MEKEGDREKPDREGGITRKSRVKRLRSEMRKRIAVRNEKRKREALGAGGVMLHRSVPLGSVCLRAPKKAHP